jgi:hypothetical protein
MYSKVQICVKKEHFAHLSSNSAVKPGLLDRFKKSKRIRSSIVHVHG